MPVYPQYTIHQIKDRRTWAKIRSEICTSCALKYEADEMGGSVSIEPDQFRSKYGGYISGKDWQSGLPVNCCDCGIEIPFNENLEI